MKKQTTTSNRPFAFNKFFGLKHIITVCALLFLLLASSLPATAASSNTPSLHWQQLFDGDRGFCVIQTQDGGYALTGANASESLLIRTDSSGNLLWTRSYKIGENDTYLPYLVQTRDEGYTLAGTVNNSYAIIKVDSTGNITWEKTYDFNVAFNFLRCLTLTSEGSYVMVGTYLNQPPTDGHTCVMKLDSQGNVEWNKTVGAVGDFVNSLIQTIDGGYAIFGTHWQSELLPARPTIIKTDSEGNVQWNSTYGGVGTGQFYYTESFSGLATNDGGYLVGGFAGETSSTWRTWLFKTDSTGTMLWNVTYGDVGSLAYTLVMTGDGGYAFVGIVDKKDAWVAKLDAEGGMDWNLTARGSSIEAFCNAIVQSNDGDYAVVGTKGEKIWFAKITTSPQTLDILLILLAIAVAAIIIAVVLIVYRPSRHKQ